MSEPSVEERVLMLLENLVLDGHEVTEISTWEQMGLDSLHKIEFMMDMEDEFNISVPDEVMSYLESVDDVVGYIERITRK
jgi:acyl carrier protein